MSCALLCRLAVATSFASAFHGDYPSFFLHIRVRGLAALVLRPYCAVSRPLPHPPRGVVCLLCVSTCGVLFHLRFLFPCCALVSSCCLWQYYSASIAGGAVRATVASSHFLRLSPSPHSHSLTHSLTHSLSHSLSLSVFPVSLFCSSHSFCIPSA